MATAHTRTTKALRLGRYLRELREQFQLSITDVAADIEVNHMRLRRIEKGLHQPQEDFLQALFDRYHVTLDRRKELLDLAADAWRSGWWLEYDDVLQDVFAVLEDEASRILSFQAQVVPGLLQVDAYSRALAEGGVFPCDAREAAKEKRVRARRERRAILERPDPPRLHAVLGEAAIRQQVGGSDVMREQLEHLLRIGNRTNVILQVLPFSAGAHAGLEGPFVIFGFAHEDDPDVVHTENLSGSAYSETAGAVQRFRLAWGSVTGSALTPSESAALIAALATER